MSAPRRPQRRAPSVAATVAAAVGMAAALAACSSDEPPPGTATATSTTSPDTSATSATEEPDSLTEATGTADPTPSAIAAPMLERRLDCSTLGVDFTDQPLQSSGLTVGGPAGSEVFSADCQWSAQPSLTATQAREMPGTVSTLALTASDMDFAELRSSTLDEAGDVTDVSNGADGLTFIATGDGTARAEVLLPDDDGYVDCSWTQAQATPDFVATVRSLCEDFRVIVGQARMEAYASRTTDGGSDQG